MLRSSLSISHFSGILVFVPARFSSQEKKMRAEGLAISGSNLARANPPRAKTERKEKTQRAQTLSPAVFVSPLSLSLFRKAHITRTSARLVNTTNLAN